MLSVLRKRLAREEQGFTLIELLVVIIIIGILLAIAVPSYLTFRDRAEDTTAKANVRAALPSVEAYAGDNGGYTGMDRTDLLTYDPSIPADVVVAGTVDADSYCIQAGSVAGDQFYYSVGDGRTAASPATVNGVVTAGVCA